MPLENSVPPCPAAVVAAKPRRSQWCLEEAWDLAVALDASVEETRHPGIFIIPWRPGLTRTEVFAATRRYKFSFASRVVVPGDCILLHGVDPDLVRTRVENVLRKGSMAAAGTLKFIASLRGESRRYLDSTILRDIIRALGLRVDRKARHVVAVEGFDDYILLAWGRRASCGYQCLLVGVEPDVNRF